MLALGQCHIFHQTTEEIVARDNIRSVSLLRLPSRYDWSRGDLYNFYFSVCCRSSRRKFHGSSGACNSLWYVILVLIFAVHRSRNINVEVKHPKSEQGFLLPPSLSTICPLTQLSPLRVQTARPIFALFPILSLALSKQCSFIRPLKPAAQLYLLSRTRIFRLFR